MCLAIPAKITEIKNDSLATVDILGVTRDIALDLTPNAGVGDFVLVHAGFAIEVVDPEYAQETIDLVKQFPELIGAELPSAEVSAREETLR
ncbi:HypC/HybG/HupF family hydrogenase formation chaperone [Eggerthella sp. YY7918]|uniref:HypC/HybG/HupF family hydrogenase formation chaperone n=1 Tax=Eggerthella sp. (strain YY7918) TaxID=502558 RepID=UPI0002171071|nr:HypC/HybG/HupF family hydrogenase formation chaperone [Eggerthella sp. YY7918]BAK43414.1 hydrogenase maturation factor [Eggerthella sp. YY7918]